MAYQHILVPVDGSSTSLIAVSKAAELAKAFNSKITAILVLTIDPFIGVEFLNTKDLQEEAVKSARAQATEILNDVQKRFDSLGIQADTKIVEGQVISDEIVQTAQSLSADIIVIGSHGRKGFKKLVLGSVTQNVLSDVHLPVLVIRD